MPPESEQHNTDTPEFTVGGALERLAEERIMSGHPAEEPPESEEGDQGPDKPLAEGGDKPADGGTPPETPEPPKLKYKSQEEAEKAQTEAERRMHAATEEAATAKREAEELKRQLEEAKKAPAAVPEEKPKVSAEEAEAQAEARIEQALDEIDKLDEDAPDYRKQVARIWRKVGVGAASPEVVEEIVDRRLKAEREEAERVAAATDAATIRKRANTLATEAGLDMAEGSDDFDIFWVKAGKAPKDIPFEDQVKWTVAEVNRIKGKAASPEADKEAQRLAEEAQRRNAVLERGGGGPTPSTKQTGRASIGSIMDKQMEGRRI
jgi:hypothetical protein